MTPPAGFRIIRRWLSAAAAAALAIGCSPPGFRQIKEQRKECFMRSGNKAPSDHGPDCPYRGITMMTNRFTVSAFVLCMLGAFAVGSSAMAAVYDLYDDFDTSGSLSTNLGPDGVWSFEATAGTSTAAPFDEVDPAYWMDGTSPAWIFTALGDNSVPAISAITNPAGGRNPAWDLQQGDVGLHQLDATTRLITIDWTAPQATTVDLTGLIWGADLTQSDRPQEVTLSHLDSSETLHQHPHRTHRFRNRWWARQRSKP